MADEAYRAVFLRVHPTGKMVLSLTTEADGNEPGYAQLVADELGVPALDVKVVPADTDRFGVGHGFNTSPSAGTSAAIVSATGKIRAKAQLLAGVALNAAPETLEWTNGAWAAGAADPTQLKTVEEIALYAHGSGALPPGVEGGLDAQTVYRDWSPGCGTAGRRTITTSTSSTTFRAPNSVEYGVIPHSVCLTTAAPLIAPSAPAQGRMRSDGSADEGQLALHAQRAAVGACRPRWSGTRCVAASGSRRRSSARCSPCRRRRAPGCRRCPRARVATSHPRRARDWSAPCPRRPRASPATR